MPAGTKYWKPVVSRIVKKKEKKNNIEHHLRTVEGPIGRYETAKTASLELPRGAMNIGREVAPEASSTHTTLSCLAGGKNCRRVREPLPSGGRVNNLTLSRAPRRRKTK